MKVLNPTKLAQRKILFAKMNRINSDEENKIIRQQVEDHNRQTGDNIKFFKIISFTFDYDYEGNIIETRRSVIPKEYKPVFPR